MKKISFFVTLLITLSTQAQDVSDAVRYSQENINGTARFRAMGGAFGAVGGDFSAININPAGSAIFANNQIAATLSSYNTKNRASYFGSEVSANDYTIDLNQAGGVFVFKNDNESSDWKKLTIALNYENTNNFDNTIFTSGVNPSNSISSYFLNYANQNGGVPLNNLTGQSYEELPFGQAQAFLGFQGFIIDPDAEQSNAYVSAISHGSFYQENAFVSAGYNGKLSLNLAASYKDRIYIGMNINSHYFDYRQSTSFFELNENDPTVGSQRIRFNNDLYTYGSGLSFNLGAIGKITEAFRLGLAYESPTWYRFNDEMSQYLSNRTFDAETNELLDETIVDPNVIILYDTYSLQTPGKWTASAAYVFGKFGLISIDYSMKDYGNAEFRPQDEYFRPVNSNISNTLDMSSELRIGAEHRIKQWSLRGGYRWEQSPYKNGKTIGDLTGYSGGVGYNFGNTKVDLSYSFTQRDRQQAFFSQGFTDAPAINTINNNVSVSVVFEL